MIAEVRMRGADAGFFTMLPIWSIEVPSPGSTSPPQLFSRKESAAKPTMLATAQPATCRASRQTGQAEGAQMSAEEMGRVRANADEDGAPQCPSGRAQLGGPHNTLPMAVSGVPMAGPHRRTGYAGQDFARGVTKISTWFPWTRPYQARRQ